MITGILFCLALIPTAMSTAVSPKPLTEVQLDLKALYRNSPAAFVGCILIGIANGAWGTLGAVFGAKSGISTTEIALMVSVTIAAGASDANSDRAHFRSCRPALCSGKRCFTCSSRRTSWPSSSARRAAKS
jgi:hypothetical protein